MLLQDFGKHDDIKRIFKTKFYIKNQTLQKILNDFYLTFMFYVHTCTS